MMAMDHKSSYVAGCRSLVIDIFYITLHNIWWLSSRLWCPQYIAINIYTPYSLLGLERRNKADNTYLCLQEVSLVKHQWPFFLWPSNLTHPTSTNRTCLDLLLNKSYTQNPFHKFLWAHYRNFVKIHVAFTWNLMIQSSHHFAHASTTELSWHVQNCFNW